MERNAAVSAGQSSRCRLTLKRPHIRRDIQRCKESRRIVDDLKRTVRCPLTFARWGIPPWKSCGLLRARGNHRARKRHPDKNTQRPSSVSAEDWRTGTCHRQGDMQRFYLASTY
ncbi:conserved hypothetical protein [Trichinella spiralis]|uniref:hypothetical protein n=1 Tax=Trichinella spiralis TaxID=6334 RepID=UPI0001EFDE0C|nr:conserved hypothetical protein [Trichinella spiralis]